MKRSLLLLATLLCAPLPSALQAEEVKSLSLPEVVNVPPSRPEVLQANSMPEEEVACRTRLKAAGVTFEEHPPLEDPAGCAAPWPISVTSLSDNVAVRPAATLNCQMAEATSRFASEQAQSIANDVLGSGMTAINQVSSYVCRPRTSDTAKLSEHAFANALDWGSVELADGRTVAVLGYKSAASDLARFMTRLRKAACGPFKTVLGPGSDADHADHFHFDLAERRNGGTWCR